MAKRFPSASSGLRKIFTAEILMLISGVCVGIASALIGFYDIIFNNFDDPRVITGVVLSFVGFILVIIAGILQLVGIHAAGRDSHRFHNAFTFIILAIIIYIVAGIMSSCWPETFGNNFTIVAEGVASVFELIAAYFVMTGIRDLATESHKPKIASLASGIWNTYCFLIIIAVLVSLLALTNISTVFLGWIALIAMIVGIIADIAYIILLYRAQKEI